MKLDEATTDPLEEGFWVADLDTHHVPRAIAEQVQALGEPVPYHRETTFKSDGFYVDMVVRDRVVAWRVS